MNSVLPPVATRDYYRVTLVGDCEAPDLEQLQAEFSRFPNLTLRDKTTRPVDIWNNAGEDTFEGTYFGLLQQAMEHAETEAEKEEIQLAAELSRRLMEGQEVALP